MNFSELANFIWSVADLLRGDYKQADYGKIILPFTLLRRLECVLEPTKADVLAAVHSSVSIPYWRWGLRIPEEEGNCLGD